MDVEAWLTASFDEVIEVDDLTSSAAASFARFVDRHAAELAAVVALRRGGAGELVELTFRTGRPQQSVVPIRRTERIEPPRVFRRVICSIIKRPYQVCS
jgi:hypothetical protein